MKIYLKACDELPGDVEYLLEVDRAGLSHYDCAAYAGLDIGGPHAHAEDYTRSCAACLGWRFERVQGGPALLRALLHCNWDEGRFLIVPPRHVIRPTADETVIRAEPEPRVNEHKPAS